MHRKHSFHLYNVFPWLINRLKDGRYTFFPQNTLFKPAMSLKLSDNKIVHVQHPQRYNVIENGSLHLISFYSLGNKNGNFHLNFLFKYDKYVSKDDGHDYLNRSCVY